MIDTGIFSFFSERTVINLDGLVNSFEYQEILREQKLGEYLQENRIKYYVGFVFKGIQDSFHENYGTYTQPIQSHKYMTESDPLVLHESNEIYRSDPQYFNGFKMVFIIWKL